MGAVIPQGGIIPQSAPGEEEDMGEIPGENGESRRHQPKMPNAAPLQRDIENLGDSEDDIHDMMRKKSEGDPGSGHVDEDENRRGDDPKYGGDDDDDRREDRRQDRDDDAVEAALNGANMEGADITMED